MKTIEITEAEINDEQRRQREACERLWARGEPQWPVPTRAECREIIRWRKDAGQPQAV